MGRDYGKQKGNKWAVKLKEPAVRQKAFQEMCDWVANGKSYKSFVFYHGDIKMTGEGIEEMSRRHPEEFDSQEKEVAHALAYQYWERILEDTATGRNPHGNTATLQMVFRNKFGWDRRDGTVQSEVDKEKFKFLSDWMDRTFKEVNKVEKE